jgi:hypothetical protein
MDYHQGLKIAGGLLALLLFIPLIRQLWTHGADGQSGATWLLWGTLDTVLAVSIIEQRGNFLLPLAFAIGDLLLVILLAVKRKFSWGRFETVILAMVVGCIVAWKFSGPRIATIASTLGVVIAGVPGLLAMLKQPRPKVGNVWAGYVVANLLSFFGGDAMTIEQRFAPGVFTLCVLAMFAASRRKI